MENASGRRHRRIALGILVFLAGYMAIVCVGLQIALTSRMVDSLGIQPTTVVEIYTAMIAHGVVAALCAIGALFLRHSHSVKSKAPKVVLLATLVLLLTSCDRIVSILCPPPGDQDMIFMPHAERNWFHWPRMVGFGSGRRIETNSLGFRSPEIPLKKAPGEFRALFIGDSVTFGFRLDREQGYVSQAEGLLREACPDRAIHAINAAVSGYGTAQECHLLQHEGMRLDPDIVILCYCLNDMTDLICQEGGVLNSPQPYFGTPNDSHWSGIVRALRSYYTKQRMMRIGNDLQWGHTDPFEGQDPLLKTWDDVYREPPVPSVKEAWRRSLEDLDKLDSFCRSKELPWVLVFSPISGQLGENARFDDPGRRLRDWAQEKKIPYVDIGQTFEKDMAATGKPAKRYMMDPMHPSAAGCRLMAETVVQFLEANHLPPFDRRESN